MVDVTLFGVFLVLEHSFHKKIQVVSTNVAMTCDIIQWDLLKSHFILM